MGGAAPLWITIVLAVMTVIGTVSGAWGGQWIAARRDDKRWEREAKREDLRWRREQERLKGQRQQDLRKEWRDRRIAAYTDFLLSIDSVLQILTTIRRLNEYFTEEAAANAIDELIRMLDNELTRAQTASKTVAMIAPDDVRRQSEEAVLTTSQLMTTHEYMHDNNLGIWPTDTEMDKIRELRNEFLERIRTDLDVESSDTTSSVTPSPPSETTS